MNDEGRPPDDEGIDGWRAVPVRCRFCGYRHWSVHPVGTDERALECPSCHLMEAETIEIGAGARGEDR